MALLNDTIVGFPANTVGSQERIGKAEKHLVDRHHPRRQQVESFIARRYLEVHGARISCFMPLLAALFDAEDRVLAAVGIRNAAAEPLFLEYYLDAPVERAIVSQSGCFMLPPGRASIVEIGNLASIDRSASRRLFGLLARYLSGRGFDWAVFTGCSALHRMFKSLGIETLALGRALQSRLPADQQTWGSYYEDNPTVVAGMISRGCRVFADSADPRTTGRPL